MPETLLEELKRYVAFGEGDERALRALHVAAAPRLGAVADAFYARILGHDGARRALVGGESQVGRLKLTLRRWMDEVLLGPWDEAWFEAHCRIGRVHVRIELPQHYMFGAMNVLRAELGRIGDEAHAQDDAGRAVARGALDKVLDLELAIMLHSYREDLVARATRSERLATFGQLVGSIGHELRNPLGVIETSLFLLRGPGGDDERARKHLDRIAQQVRVANGIINDLLELVRDRPLRREAVDLAAVVREAAGSVSMPGGVRLDLDGLGTPPTVQGDPGQLRQLFRNLLENAAYAASPTGLVAVLAGSDGAMVTVAVEDTGPGVDESVRGRLFEPLITTKPTGIGLGLALVKRVAERHGGSVAHEARTGGGTRFLVRLPLP